MGQYPEPVVFMNHLESWLNARFGGGFQNCGDSLKHGVQRDTYSCLICAANTIAHAVFGDKLWNSKSRAADRLYWFLKFTGRDVSALVPFI